jgi:hypothetical protein
LDEGILRVRPLIRRDAAEHLVDLAYLPAPIGDYKPDRNPPDTT